MMHFRAGVFFMGIAGLHGLHRVIGGCCIEVDITSANSLRFYSLYLYDRVRFRIDSSYLTLGY